MAHQTACLLIFVLWIAKSLAVCDVPNLVCTHPVPTTCQLDNINIFSDTPAYTISGYNISKVTHIVINSNKLAIFSPEFCKNFPLLSQIHANNIGIEQLDQNAFDSCSRLTILSMVKNQLQVLPPTAFRGATQLQSVTFGSNQLVGISDRQFETNIRLRSLYFENNFLGNFPASAIKNCPGLSTLRLHTNNLIRLEYATLLQNSPGIVELSVNGNLFPCSVLQNVLQAYGGLHKLTISRPLSVDSDSTK